MLIALILQSATNTPIRRLLASTCRLFNQTLYRRMFISSLTILRTLGWSQSTSTTLFTFDTRSGPSGIGRHCIGEHCSTYPIFPRPPPCRLTLPSHLKPGGYIEFQELEYTPRCDDETLKPDSPYALRDYINYLEAGIRMYGSEVHAVRTLPDELRAAGFENVKVTTHKCPLGMWPRDKRLRLCGLFLRSAVMDGLRGVSRRPLLALGWTQLQIEMFLVDVRKAILDPNIHAYFTYHDVYGRKPLS